MNERGPRRARACADADRVNDGIDSIAYRVATIRPPPSDDSTLLTTSISSASHLVVFRYAGDAQPPAEDHGVEQATPLERLQPVSPRAARTAATGLLLQ